MNASKQRYGAKDLRQLFEGARTVVIARGKKIVEIDLARDADAWERLEELALGPTGNLRAPALRIGATWLIGFHEDAYAQRLG